MGGAYGGGASLGDPPLDARKNKLH